jgi:hypothetical protein
MGEMVPRYFFSAKQSFQHASLLVVSTGSIGSLAGIGSRMTRLTPM